MMILLLCGCGPKTFKPNIEPPKPLELTQTENYSIQEDLDKITKPSPIKPIFIKLESDGTITQLNSPEGATHVLLAPTEYSKIGALLKLAKTYKAIVIDQEELVNTYIAQTNALKEMLKLERQISLYYYNLWVNAENLRLQAEYNQQINSITNKITTVIISVGAVAVVALAL